MAKVKEKNPLTRSNWVANFTLVGIAKVNENYTFTINKKSESSDWIYNRLNLGIDCGNKHGVVYAEMSGGYGSERTNNVIYVHGKDESGNDDFKNQYTVAWNDREEESILEDLGEACFIRVGLEKDTKGETYTKKFLSPYDAIAYIQEHLEDGMVVNVRGQLRYSIYNDKVQCRKEINSIYLSKAEPDAYRATFVQTMLLDKDSAGKDTIDLEKKVMYVNAYLLEKFKEFNGWDLTEGGKVKGGIFVPLRKTFEYDLSNKTPDQILKTYSSFFKIKKGVTQITFNGEFVESGATVQATEADVTDDIKVLVDLGMYTMEQAIALCAANGSVERRMILTSVNVRKKENDDGTVTPIIQRTDEAFAEEDLQLDCLVPKETVDEEEVPFEEAMNATDEMDEESADLAALLASLQG